MMHLVGGSNQVKMKRESRADYSKANNIGIVIFDSNKNRIEVIPPKKITNRRCRSETPNSDARGQHFGYNAKETSGPGRYVKRGHA